MGPRAGVFRLWGSGFTSLICKMGPWYPHHVVLGKSKGQCREMLAPFVPGRIQELYSGAQELTE